MKESGATTRNLGTGFRSLPAAKSMKDSGRLERGMGMG